MANIKDETLALAALFQSCTQIQRVARSGYVDQHAAAAVLRGIIVTNPQTCEDIYHPYGMFNFKNLEDYYSKWNNMLVVTTGVLPRSGGINPTASLLPVIDDFVSKKFIS